MKATWRLDFGQVGAVLKRLEQHGVGAEMLEVLLEDNDVAKQTVEAINSAIRQSTIVHQETIHVFRGPLNQILGSCLFENISPGTDLSDSEEGIPTSIIGSIVEVALFRFYDYQARDGSLRYGPERVFVELIKEMGYSNAPIRVFLSWIKHLRDKCTTSSGDFAYLKLVASLKGSALVSLDPFYRTEKGFQRAVTNHSFNPHLPRLEFGSVDLASVVNGAKHGPKTNVRDYHFFAMKLPSGLIP